MLFKTNKILKKLFLALSLVLVAQSFIPVYSTEPNCNNGTPVCPSGFSPACSGGRNGIVVCNAIFGPSCKTDSALFPDAVTCIFSSSGCIFCLAVIPQCGPGQRLVPQTCSRCAFCEPIVCPQLNPICSPPPPNCTYINIPKDENGCPIGCGTLVCSSSSSSGGDSCKCPTGLHYDNVNNRCVSGTVLCPLCGSSPVCGCNGITYCNSCEAYKAGVKTFTNGACGSTSSSSSSGSTSQCGSATCRNGEICVVIDPCRGRPNCIGQISQFCALPNAIPSCSNGQIMCNVGDPICNNTLTNVPICGSSLGFSNDLSVPGCTNPNRTTLSVNSAYCSTSNLRIPDEGKLSCTTKKLCPPGKRFESCREDRHNCKCVCPFEIRVTGTPRCDKHNNAICSHGLKPTCSNSNNTASCYSKKLTCVNNIDGSIDLIDTIECK